MIRQATGDDILSISVESSFAVRIRSLYLCYGDQGYSFVDFWVQEMGEGSVAWISRFEDQFCLFLSDDSDLEEIAQFLRFWGGSAVLYDSRYTLNILSKKNISGDVLAFTDSYISISELYHPDIQAYYDVLLTCAADDFRVPPYRMFLSDVVHRQNRGHCTLVGVRCDGVLASCAMTVSDTASASIIGAVATRPDYRRRGLSRTVVRSLSSMLSTQGKRVYVLSSKRANTDFYRNSGFSVVAGFIEAFL